MSDPKNLKELYLEEMGDLWSANDQMRKTVVKMAETASDSELKSQLEKSAKGIQDHTDTIKTLISEAGGNVEKEHCKGMEGLVTEAHKHAVDADMPAAVKDVSIISQYHRMSHYGIAGFGTAKAYAEALGLQDHARKLDGMVSDIYAQEAYMSRLAERSKNLQAV
ncbi:MAG: ferritin-like domain-containing protein [Paracoccaceae bacterium]